MGEGGAEVRAVDGTVARGLRGVDILAAAAVELDCLLIRDVGQADGKKGMGLAEDTGTSSEIGAFVLVQLH